MAFVSPTDSITAFLTTKGRAELARMILGEVSFKLSAFQVGRGGYQVANPVKVELINTTLSALIDPVPDSSDRRDFVTIEQPIAETTVAPVCRLNPGDTDVEYGLGELGLFATYLRDDVTPGNVGTDFLFGVAHFPLIGKTPNHAIVWRVIIAL